MVLSPFCLGVAGGIWAQAFLLPYLAWTAPFEDWKFIQQWNSRTTIIREVQEIVVTEAQALERTIERVQKVSVRVQSTKGKTILEGSGFIVTSDGLILTLADLVPEGFRAQVELEGEEKPREALVLKRDGKRNLALLKIEEGNLPTTSFADALPIKLGTGVFLVGKTKDNGSLATVVNQGIVKSQSPNTITTTIFEEPFFNGSPLFNREGRVLGLTTIDKEGRVAATPFSLLRSFAGF